MHMLLAIHSFEGGMNATASWLLHGAVSALFLAQIFSVLGLRGALAPKGAIASHICAVLATLCYALYFAMRFHDLGLAPLSSYFEVLHLVAFAGLVAYFGYFALRPRSGLALWVFPSLLACAIASLALGGTIDNVQLEHRPPALQVVHVTLAIVATTFFALASSLASALLVQGKGLKRRRSNAATEQLPSMEHLSTGMGFALWAGWLVLSASLICGFWLVRHEFLDWLVRPVILASLVMWVVFAVAALGRTLKRLHTGQVVTLVLFGFSLTLGVFLASGAVTGWKHQPGTHGVAEPAKPGQD